MSEKFSELLKRLTTLFVEVPFATIDSIDHVERTTEEPVPQVPDLSVILPVYNQERTVASALDGICQVLVSSAFSYELIAVNDGSSDNTLSCLLALQAQIPALKIVGYDSNKGKGYAVKTGILSSRGRMVLFIDSDAEISPRLISEFIAASGQFDIVIGSKKHPLSAIRKTRTRWILSKLFSWLSTRLVGLEEISDSQVGIKLGRADVMRKIFESTTIRRYAFDVEFLTMALLLGATVKEMPVRYQSVRTGFKVREILKMFLDLVRIRYRLKVQHWYQKQLVTKPLVHANAKPIRQEELANSTGPDKKLGVSEQQTIAQ